MIDKIGNLKELYRNLLESDIYDYNGEVCTFFPQIGEKYYESSPKCLFVGKAVNGWVSNSRDINILFDTKNDNRIINRDDQMKWVHKQEGINGEYNSKSSAFWRLIKGITLEVIQNKDWYNHIAWTNLYKVAPNEGNPNASLQRLQRDSCINILNEEISLLNPDYVIFLTSSWEEFFLNSLSSSAIEAERKNWGNYETSYKRIGDTIYISSKHPQGKPEGTHKKAIIDIINNS